MKKSAFIFLFIISAFVANAQKFYEKTPEATRWVDSVFNTLSPEQKIAQLMIIRAHSNLGADHVAQVTSLINTYNVGGLCFFQGGPVRQANLTNYYQGIAKTPLMVCIDGEWGLGMRLDSVISFPRQLMMGAVTNANLVYEFGKAVGEQCKRLGIHVNYAPVVDINNNPDNPVINDRSFGEDKYKVALFGTKYMQGMQDMNVMACAKHFPGHGDVAVDSHLDLPVINKTREQLDSLELYPFKKMIEAGVGSFMVAHLYIPSIDSTANRATSLSPKNVTDLLRKELNYQGLTFTDALEMQGVAKFYPAGDASVQSLIAGNDMLCLPGDVPGSIAKTLAAIKDGRLTQQAIDDKVKKVLLTKFHLGLNNVTPIDINNITEDINAKTNAIKKLVAEQSITLLKQNNKYTLPIENRKGIAYIGIGISGENSFAKNLGKKVDKFYYDYKQSGSADFLNKLDKYETIIVGVHNYSRRPANNFGISNSAVNLMQSLAQNDKAIFFAFGNPYAIKNFCNAQNIVACYEDDKIVHNAAFDMIKGKIKPQGKLPVSVCEEFKFGAGVTNDFFFNKLGQNNLGMGYNTIPQIDDIAEYAINNGAMPGCIVFAAKDGKLLTEKAYGYTEYNKKQKVTTEMLYDLASVTKISATTIAIMKLYDEDKILLDETVGDYLPYLRGTDKEHIKIREILLHQAGLYPFIPFYTATIDKAGNPLPEIYSRTKDSLHLRQVADSLYIINTYIDTMHKRIAESKLSEKGKYVYSDIDFIFLGEIVEAVTGTTLDKYVDSVFYQPMGMKTTTFNPLEKFPQDIIVPTENEKHFRQQLLHGTVHDEGAAMFGGVAGHAGLFSNVSDLAMLYQMLLDHGRFKGKRYLKRRTVRIFTRYNSKASRRGYGFDKPEKDNAKRKTPYPSKLVSSQAFGHTGFTGICVWVDPKHDLIYIFYSNRVNPTRDNNKISSMNVRGNIQDAIYQFIK